MNFGDVSLLKPWGSRESRPHDSATDPSAPTNLLRVFAALLVAVAVGIAVLVGGGMYLVYRLEMLRDAEVMATTVGEALLAQERELLLAPSKPGAMAVQLAEEHFTAFDRRIRRYLQPFGIYKIKIFDAEARIAYSTDLSLIGRAESDNPMLREVLARGRTMSAIIRRAQVPDLGGGVRFDVDVVETYLPIVANGRVVGSFEVYLDIGRHYEQLRRSVATSIGVVGLVIACAFVVLYAFARKGAARYARALAEIGRRDDVDSLTGALNHKVLIARAEELRKRRAETGASWEAVSLVLVEMDQFLGLVDSGAPVMVDDMVRAVASGIRSVLGDEDLLGRYRGGTFLAVVGRSDLSDAVLFAERIRRTIAARAADAEFGRPVTASIGVTRCDPAEALAVAIRRAEDALQRAKADGRDCVRAA